MTDELKTPQTEEATPSVDETTAVAVEETVAEDVQPVVAAETEAAPVEAVLPQAPESAPAAPISAEQFLANELAAARASLKGIQIYGSLLVLILAVYLGTITARFMSEFEPNRAVETATGFVAQQIEAHRDAFVSEVSTRVPAMIQEAPDYVLEQLPTYREAAEAKFEEELRKYCQSTTEKLNANLDQYITNNKESIKAVLEASKDPDAVKTLGPTIHDEVMAYLKEEPAEGQSIGAQVEESLQMLKHAEQRLNYLATAKKLTPSEMKTRRTIAIIANTVEKEQLQPIALPQLQVADEEE